MEVWRRADEDHVQSVPGRSDGEQTEQEEPAGAVMSGGLNDLKPCEFPNLCEGERCRDG